MVRGPTGHLIQIDCFPSQPKTGNKYLKKSGQNDKNMETRGCHCATRPLQSTYLIYAVSTYGSRQPRRSRAGYIARCRMLRSRRLCKWKTWRIEAVGSLGHLYKRKLEHAGIRLAYQSCIDSAPARKILCQLLFLAG